MKTKDFDDKILSCCTGGHRFDETCLAPGYKYWEKCINCKEQAKDGVIKHSRTCPDYRKPKK